MPRRNTTTAEAKQRILDYSEPVTESGCWIWTRCTSRQGYGQITICRKTIPASRVSYELFVGPIPDGMFVCHSCDTPPCVNPAHLWIGSPKDNVSDMIKKGR